MPPDPLSDYFNQVEAALQSFENYHIEKYEEEFLTSTRANLRVRIRFAKGHLLELNEAVTIESESVAHLSYRYHFQDKDNQLIFRYDNTPHFPNLKTFPHHKHSQDSVEEATQPTMTAVVTEVQSYLSR